MKLYIYISTHANDLDMHDWMHVVLTGEIPVGIQNPTSGMYAQNSPCAPCICQG